ncbi:hypothetical protein E1B28_006463 [Marasmius oreades]|uniref:Transmembrane protein n=1 Tax=Marasmius oreades TaxID=181124 RepID=A0A9P7S5K7_9AGAR|nr:uncharacterized protein E1B28_006463 [Marasmius oreades]KAG7095757.1 hypothetical protein E1B28_006463 [Marasmius oreades]
MSTQFAGTIALINSWANVFLYSMEVTLSAYFFQCHKTNRYQKFSLGGSLFLDTVCSAVVCYYTWLRIDDPMIESWSRGIITILTYFVSVCEQLYLVHRYWIIARNRVVVFFVLLGAIVHLVFGFISGLLSLVVPGSVHSYGILSLTIAAVTCAATDLLIAINIFYATRNIDTINPSTQSLLFRLSIIGISSGIVTATATTLKIILLFTSLRGFAFLFNLVGRIYTLTIVVNCIALERQKNARARSIATENSETQTSNNSRSPGSVVLTTLDFRTSTVPEDTKTDTEVQNSIGMR